MATYTDEQLQAAASKLREIYDVQTRSERLRTARRFGYESKPESRLRIYRRLTRGKAQPNSRFDATKYLNDYVLRFDQDVLDNDGEETVLNGRIPPYSFSQNMQMVSIVAFIAARSHGDQIFNTQVNVNPFRFRDYEKDGVIRKETPKNIRLNPVNLLKAYQQKIRDTFEKAMRDESYPVVAIAFNRRGVDILRSVYDSGDIDREIDFGAAFLPTSYTYVDNKRQPTLTREPTFRPFPKDRRRRIVQYVNRAYPQLKRSGRL